MKETLEYFKVEELNEKEIEILKQEFFNEFGVAFLIQDIMKLLSKEQLADFVMEEPDFFHTKNGLSNLINTINKEKITKFIIQMFNENFTYEELYEIFRKHFNLQELKVFLEKLGHDFTLETTDYIEEQYKYIFEEINCSADDYETLLIGTRAIEIARDRLSNDLDNEKIKNEYNRLDNIIKELYKTIEGYV